MEIYLEFCSNLEKELDEVLQSMPENEKEKYLTKELTELYHHSFGHRIEDGDYLVMKHISRAYFIINDVAITIYKQRLDKINNKQT